MIRQIAALALGTCLTLDVGTGEAQSSAAAPLGNQPPVLSTTPTIPPGAQTEPSQMSGMPLQVGDLPPGTVAVRVIRKTFGQNVVSVPVELRVGDASAAETSVTDPEGRATFHGLRVGAVVRTKATVDEETLESQSFQLPAQGGVRLVLVAGVGANVPSSQVQMFESSSPGTGGPPAAPAGIVPHTNAVVTTAENAPMSVAITAPPPGATDAARSVKPVSVTAGLLLAAAVGGFWWLRGARRDRPEKPRPTTTRSRSRPPPSTAESVSRHGLGSSAERERLFDELLAIERARTIDSGTDAEHGGRRAALIDAIVQLDSLR